MTSHSGHSRCKKVVKNIKVTFLNTCSVLFDVYQENCGYNDYVGKSDPTFRMVSVNGEQINP